MNKEHKNYFVIEQLVEENEIEKIENDIVFINSVEDDNGDMSTPFNVDLNTLTVYANGYYNDPSGIYTERYFQNKIIEMKPF